MSWTPGDLSGSQTLQPEDHLYASHVNELRNAVDARTVTTVGSDSGCDYVTDGTADDVQINAALSAVTSAGGGKVYIKAGTYDITASVTIGSDTIVEGEGSKTLLKANASLGGLTNVVKNANSTNTNIVVMNLAIDGNQSARSGKSAGADGSGNNVMLSNVTDSTIKGIWSYNGAQACIALIGTTTESTVENCVAYNSWNHNILVSSNDQTGSTIIKRNLIRENFSYGAGQGAGQGVGIELANYAQENVVTGNLSRNNLEGGIHCYFNSTGNVISNNVSLSNSQNGIAMVDGCNYNIISNNVIKDCTEAGVNVIPGTTTGGTNLVISGNTITSCGWNGVRGTGVGDLNNSIISNNEIDSCGAGGIGNINFGIWLAGTQNTLVSNNYINNSYSSGINADSPFYLQLLDNQIVNSGAGGSGTSNHAIVLQTTSAMADCQIRGNTILFTQGTGIIVNYNAVRINIAENTIRNCTSNSGMNLSGITYSTISNNTIANADNYGMLIHKASTSPFRESTNNSITNNVCTLNTLGGIVEQDSSDYNAYVGNQVLGNTASNMVLVGSHNEVGLNVGY